MKATVDPDRCQGHARCWEICPEVFDLDEEGHASVIVDVVPVELEDKARQAVINCPERAISVD
jgi:ferredoxin